MRIELNKLLDDNWLYDRNWDYYNSEPDLVREVLTVLENKGPLGITDEEFLELEMSELKKYLRWETDFLTVSETIQDPGPQASVNELLDFRKMANAHSKRVMKRWSNSNKSSISGITDIKVMRAKFYNCPREVK